MAACEKNLRHYTRVLAALETYQKEGGALLTDQDRQDAIDLTNTVKTLVSSLNVTSNEPGADVFVDDEKIGTTSLPAPVLMARVRREVVTTVPKDRLVALKLPIQWLCWEEADGLKLDADGIAISNCPENQTCIAGTCSDEAGNTTSVTSSGGTTTGSASTGVGGSGAGGAGGTGPGAGGASGGTGVGGSSATGISGPGSTSTTSGGDGTITPAGGCGCSTPGTTAPARALVAPRQAAERSSRFRSASSQSANTCRRRERCRRCG